MSFSISEPAAPAAGRQAPLEWEEIDCPLCDSTSGTQLLEAPDRLPAGSGRWFAIVQCQDCGLCFTNPRPTLAAMKQFYPDDYRPHQPRPSPEPRAGHWLRRTRRPMPRRAGGRAAQLLDFGCGSGAFLEEMHRQGWHVTGIDVSPTAVCHVRDQLGLSALTGTLPHPELPPAYFDMITMWHALEHVHAPRQVLREAHRLLVPGGQLVVAVPNIDSLAFRWFGPSWYGLDLPRHLTHFAPWTLHLMLERAGFRVGSVRMRRRSSWLRWSARLAALDSPRWHRWLRNPLLSRLAGWYAHLTQQSDTLVVTAER